MKCGSHPRAVCLFYRCRQEMKKIRAANKWARFTGRNICTDKDAPPQPCSGSKGDPLMKEVSQNCWIFATSNPGPVVKIYIMVAQIEDERVITCGSGHFPPYGYNLNIYRRGFLETTSFIPFYLVEIPQKPVCCGLSNSIMPFVLKFSSPTLLYVRLTIYKACRNI